METRESAGKAKEARRDSGLVQSCTDPRAGTRRSARARARDPFRRVTSDRAIGRARGEEDERTGEERSAPATSEFALRSVRGTSSSCRRRGAFPRCDVFPRGRSRLWYARFPRRELPRNDDVQPSIMRREGERDQKHLRSLMES